MNQQSARIIQIDCEKNGNGPLGCETVRNRQA